MDRCWAETYCKGYPNRCHDLCIGYVQLANIYELSKMPKRYQYEMPLIPDPDDRDTFEFLRDFRTTVERHVNEGHGLFIHSLQKGNGKTSWACKIMNEYFRRVALSNNLRCRGLFVNVPLFLDQLRANMDERTDEMQEFQDDIQSADLVIWDDIGTEIPTNWVRQTLYKFINYRESNGLAQIYTSNISLMDLKKDDLLGERIVDRIKGQCKILEIKGSSKRAERWSRTGED